MLKCNFYCSSFSFCALHSDTSDFFPFFILRKGYLIYRNNFFKKKTCSWFLNLILLKYLVIIDLSWKTLNDVIEFIWSLLHSPLHFDHHVVLVLKPRALLLCSARLSIVLHKRTRETTSHHSSKRRGWRLIVDSIVNVQELLSFQRDLNTGQHLLWAEK